MLDDKMAATDWEATQDELIQQVARESYLQWLCDKNQQHKDNKTVRGKGNDAMPLEFSSVHFTSGSITGFITGLGDHFRTSIEHQSR